MSSLSPLPISGEENDLERLVDDSKCHYVVINVKRMVRRFLDNTLLQDGSKE